MSDNKDYIIAISKEALSEMPAAHFDGEIRLIDTPEAVGPAIAALREAGRIGFDTETRPSFHKGQNHTVALLQLSTSKCCYLFRLNTLGITPEIKSLLEDKKIEKIGLSTHDDFHNLSKLGELRPDGFVELQQFVDRFGIVDKSLTKIYGIVFGQRVSKGQRLTNWEAPELTEFQQAYAALDAYACLRIYDYLKAGNFNPNKCPFKVLRTSPKETQ